MEIKIVLFRILFSNDNNLFLKLSCVEEKEKEKRKTRS